jgi:hypothetical protein
MPSSICGGRREFPIVLKNGIIAQSGIINVFPVLGTSSQYKFPSATVAGLLKPCARPTVEIQS